MKKVFCIMLFVIYLLSAKATTYESTKAIDGNNPNEQIIGVKRCDESGRTIFSVIYFNPKENKVFYKVVSAKVYYQIAKIFGF